jgi:hypothetical protein
MRNASLLRPPASDAAGVTDSHVDRPSRPHLFRPEGAGSPREIGQLFNLRRRPGYYNADAKAALLRRAKQPPHDELFVDFTGSQAQIALSAADILLAAGDWKWHATANHETLVSVGPWSAVCWQSNKASDYLEIESPLSSGWKLRRQMLLAREDRFLLLADALIGPEKESVELRYSSSLPLVAGVKFCGARETREGWLESGGRRRATIVPPALAEWRCEFCHAELLEADGCLTLQQAALGCSLYAPLWIDLDPRRQKRPVTWRRLTVAENFAAVGRDVAAAYRIQAGREQWMFYRSLAGPGNRSVLGHNTLKSFVCQRIVAGGAMTKIATVG